MSAPLLHHPPAARRHLRRSGCPLFLPLPGRSALPHTSRGTFHSPQLLPLVARPGTLPLRARCWALVSNSTAAYHWHFVRQSEIHHFARLDIALPYHWTLGSLATRWGLFSLAIAACVLLQLWELAAG